MKSISLAFQRFASISDLFMDWFSIGLTRLRSKSAVKSRGNDPVVGFDGIEQRTDHLNDRVLSVGGARHFGLIGEMKSA